MKFRNFMDAIQDAVGISIKRQDTYFREMYTRGHEISSYSLDGGGGIRASVQGVSMMDVLLVPDIGEFDRIEVLRGSNALFGADAAPGGTINLIRKRPLQHAQILLSVTAGSWNNFRQEVDATGALALNGALRGRMVVSNARREFFYKGPEDRRQSIFGVLDYDLTDNTVAALGGSYTKSHGSPFDVTATLSRGFGMLSALSDLKLPRETAFAFDWSYFDTRVAEGFFRLEHAFGRESRLRLNATFLDSRAAYLVGSIPLFVGKSVPTVMPHYTLEPFEESHLSLEGTLTGAGEWRGHRVEWALGADLLQTSSRTRTGWYAFIPAVDIDPYNFDPAMQPAPAIPAVPEILPGPVQNPRTMTDDLDIRIGGVFASLRAQVTRPWSVIAGLRISNERVTDTNIDRPSIDEVYVDFEHENVITPYVGTLYTLDPTWSLYASYADIFAHNGGRLRSDLSLLPPMHGVTLEAGIKGAWRDGALNGSLAFYKNVQRNIAARVPEQSSVARCCYLPSEKLRAEGVDLELQGQLTRRSLIGGGYTFTRLRGRPIENLYAMPIPRHQLKVWTDYGLPGAWHRWTVGGSLHAQSTLAPVMQLAKQKSYAVLNPRVSYRFNERWQAALTVNNLFDKSYYEDIAKSAAYGEPRSYFLRLDARL
jgi:outer membrane receptor for ferric coprogen and ferric-rhodotorulic acid